MAKARKRENEREEGKKERWEHKGGGNICRTTKTTL